MTGLRTHAGLRVVRKNAFQEGVIDNPKGSSRC
jgi:hypothetical protein